MLLLLLFPLHLHIFIHFFTFAATLQTMRAVEGWRRGRAAWALGSAMWGSDMVEVGFLFWAAVTGSRCADYGGLQTETAAPVQGLGWGK